MKTNDEPTPSFESIDAHRYKVPWPDVLELNIVDRLPFLIAVFGLTRPMLLAMTNNPMLPETWQAAIDLLLVTLDVVTGEGRGGVGRSRSCRFVEIDQRNRLFLSRGRLHRFSGFLPARPAW
jgi:hypothetical protein